MIKRHVRGVGLAVVGATVFACAPIERGIGQDTGAASQTNVQTPESLQPLTVAFIGDQGWGGQARAVLRLIRAEGADLVLLQGDLDYRNDPDAWDMLMTEILGADFPVFASAGNHDEPWYGPNGYQAKLQARLNRIADATCSGDLGVQSACTFRGLFSFSPVPERYRTSRMIRTTSLTSASNWLKPTPCGESAPGTRIRS
jgi:3',5'-cyclic AMP phosphodiesterase CpdA